MAATPQPNAENCSLAELETAMRAAASGRSRDRMRAVRALIMGQAFASICSIFDVCERTLGRWVDRFNASGIDGLIDAERKGRPRRIDAETTQACRKLIENPELVGHFHWTARKFHGHLRAELALEVGYSTVLRWLRDQNYRLKVPQPWPDRQDETLRADFVKRTAERLADDQIELWYCDETGIEGDPRPRRRWAKKGEKARVVRNGDHLRVNAVGMVAPRTGELFVLEMSHSDTDSFQAFLNEANKDIVPTRARNLLIMDNASWHKSKTLEWGRFEPVFLPPYSPDLNPIEKLWMVIKANWFADFVAKDADHLLKRADEALKWAIDRLAENQVTCAVRTKL